MALSFWVKSLLLRSFHLLYLLPKVLVVIHKVHFLLWRVEINLSRSTALSFSCFKLRIGCWRRHCLSTRNILVHCGLWALPESLCLSFIERSLEIALGGGAWTETSSQRLLFRLLSLRPIRVLLSLIESKSLVSWGLVFKSRIEATGQWLFIGTCCRCLF